MTKINCWDNDGYGYESDTTKNYWERGLFTGYKPFKTITLLGMQCFI
jgi:hypothetical protein